MLGIRVDVRFHDDLSARSTSPLDNLVKVGNLEPKQDAMARRCGIGVDEVRVRSDPLAPLLLLLHPRTSYTARSDWSFRIKLRRWFCDDWEIYYRENT
jgi:hypothetical protein